VIMLDDVGIHDRTLDVLDRHAIASRAGNCLKS
jgi:hypothetical protein